MNIWMYRLKENRNTDDLRILVAGKANEADIAFLKTNINSNYSESLN